MADERALLLQIQTEKRPGSATVRCTGKIVIESSGQFSHAVRTLIPDGQPIYVDLADVTRVDSVGIGTFVSVWATAKKSGCPLKFINLNDQISDLFQITRLADMFGTTRLSRSADAVTTSPAALAHYLQCPITDIMLNTVKQA